MEFRIPPSLKDEHEGLHDQLKKATALPDRTGEAARTVAGLLHPHFTREETMALPPLGLLNDLASGNFSEGMRDVLAITDQLTMALPHMLDEHRQIVDALNILKEQAKAEHHPEVLDFAEKLILHARTEEQVTYPAAILVGKYVRLRLGLNES